MKNKMTKKVLALTLGLTMVLSMAGCGGGKDESSAGNTVQTDNSGGMDDAEKKEETGGRD